MGGVSTLINSPVVSHIKYWRNVLWYASRLKIILSNWYHLFYRWNSFGPLASTDILKADDV